MKSSANRLDRDGLIVPPDEGLSNDAEQISRGHELVLRNVLVFVIPTKVGSADHPMTLKAWKGHTVP